MIIFSTPKRIFKIVKKKKRKKKKKKRKFGRSFYIFEEKVIFETKIRW